MSIKKWLLTGIICISISQMNAQSNSNMINLSLDEAMSYALEHNRNMKNASIDVLKAEASHWKTISSMLPQANVNADYSDLFGYEINLGPGMNISMPSTIQVNATAAVALSGAQFVGLSLTNIAKSMSDINLQKTEQDIVSQVKVLYYSAKLTEQTVNLLEKNLKNIEDLYKFSQKAVDVGTAEQIDADQILVQQATFETSISGTKRSIEMIYNSLRLLLSIDPNTEITLTDSVEKLRDEDGALGLLAERFIVEDNFDYQLMEKNAEMSKKQVSMAEWAYGPSLSLAYQYNFRHNIGSTEGFNTTPENLIALSLKIPIFSSGNKLMAVREAKYEHEKTLNQLKDTEDAMLIQHRQLAYNMTSAYERFQTQEKNVEVTERVFDNISTKYEYGMASSLDVTNSATNLINAQNSYVQAVLEFVQAQIELEKLMNK